MVELRRVARQRLQIVGSRGSVLGHQANIGGGAVTRAESRYRFHIEPECHDLQVMYQNFTVGSGTGEADGPNPITVRAAIETLAETLPDFSRAALHHQLHFNGALTRVLDVSANAVLTDPLARDFGANTDIFVRTAAEFAAGQFCPVNLVASLSGSAERATQNSEATFQTYTTGAIALTGSNVQTSYGYGPAALLGIPRYSYPAVAILGGSSAWGQGDLGTGDGAGNRGFVQRGLALANIPWANIARAGDTSAFNRDELAWRKRAILQYSTDVICALGFNQLAVTPTAVQIAYLRDVWDSCRRRGLRVHQCLITVQTSSSNGWADAAGQTIDPTFGANRAVVNAAIIDAANTGVIDGHLNPGSAWEDPANPGKFVAGTTTDGTHVNSASHIAAAAIVQAYANLRII